jgi:hypothetical protein
MALVDVGLPSTTPFGAIEDQFCPVRRFLPGTLVPRSARSSHRLVFADDIG